MITELFRLDGRVAIVTGASSGLGSGFAVALAEAGADVVVGARRTERLIDVAARVHERGRRCVAVTTDVTNPSECEKLAQTAMDEFGRLDVLVNNAGIASAVPATRERPEQFREVFEVNLFGAYWMAQAAARRMKPGSSIVNLASIAVTRGNGLPQAAYVASKAAIVGLTRDLSSQWSGRKGIRVNALSPGTFLSEMTAHMSAESRDKFVAAASIPRLGAQGELDAALIFLASPASSYITGVVLPVDGGLASS
jgi:NAD(P)-dependent dehydrogenase (short-subunit alcohol dehydrogenase family)